MADVELLPLPAIERWEVTGDYAFPTATDPEGHAVDYDAHVDAMQSYARACVEANLAPLQAENERLRAEVETGDTNLAAAMSAAAELEARAERLAEALEMMVEMVEMNGFGKAAAMDTARAALAQEDRNG